jgi:uncharacterized protein YkwD
MIDVVALLLLGLLLVRGWSRGFVREGMDLVGLVLGTVLAFRLAPAVGSVVAALSGTSDEVARLIGGTMVLIAVGVGAALLTRVIEGRFHLPGLNLVNRAGGAGLAAAWGVFLATLVLTVGVVLPMPPAIAEQLDSSAVTRTLTDPDGLAQEVFSGLAGDRIVAGVLRLRELVGSRSVVIGPGERVELAAAAPDDLDDDPAAARRVFDLLNEARVENGLAALAWSDALAAVAAGHATEMYLEGYFAHESPVTGDVGDRLVAAGVPFSVAGENLALAATTNEVHEGLMESPGHRANILGETYRSVGVAVIAGPLGLMTVQVFTG